MNYFNINQKRKRAFFADELARRGDDIQLYFRGGWFLGSVYCCVPKDGPPVNTYLNQRRWIISYSNQRSRDFRNTFCFRFNQ